MGWCKSVFLCCLCKLARSLDSICLDLADNGMTAWRIYGMCLACLWSQHPYNTGVRFGPGCDNLGLGAMSCSIIRATLCKCLLSFSGLWLVVLVSCNAVRRASREPCYKRARGCAYETPAQRKVLTVRLRQGSRIPTTRENWVSRRMPSGL